MTTLHITGMKCQHCVKAVTKALENLGATEVRVDLEKEQASFAGTPLLQEGPEPPEERQVPKDRPKRK